MHLKYRGINDAFRGLVQGVFDGSIPTHVTHSRVGEVAVIEEVVTLTYERPRERVLFNEVRDASPFFHLYESLHMLAGRNDIAPLAYYAANYAAQVRDGNSTVANGAYGYRWRHADTSAMERDQLEILVEHLRDKPESRRAVLQMWDVENDLLNINESRDVCCNLSVLFSIEDSGDARAKRFLNMTVFNRSNDLVWGALGANAVHFSVLQEYMAAHLGVEVGVYNQVSNNLHCYTERWNPQALLRWEGDWDRSQDPYEDDVFKPFPLVRDPAVFDAEVPEFVELHKNSDDGQPPVRRNGGWKEPFLARVASPMCRAFHAHKARKYEEALVWCDQIDAADWRLACTSWIKRRAERYAAKGAAK